MAPTSIVDPDRILDPALRATVLQVTVPEGLRLGADAGGSVLVVGEKEVALNELVDEVERLAAGLIAQGFEPGSRVGIWLPNSAELLRWAYAVMFAGGSAVLLSPRSPEVEIRRIIAAADLRWVIGGLDDGAHLLTPPTAQVRFGRAGPGVELPTVKPDQEAICLTTSGSTGAPKLAAHAHRSFPAQTISVQVACGGPADETVLFPLPMCHVALLGNVHAFLSQGRRWVGLPQFDAAEVVRIAREENVDWVIGTPTMWELIMSRTALPDPSLRFRRVNYGGAPMTADRAAALGAAFGCEVGHTYGSTETGGYSVFLGPDLVESKAGSVGRLLPPYDGLSVRSLESDHELGTDEVGEICLRGPAVTLGYVNQPEETAQTLRDGWCHTGDLGRMDPDGVLWVTGRIKEQISRGGLKIGAREVELVIEGVGGVTAAKVFGVPDPVLGERVVAVVEAPDGTVHPAAIRDAVSAALADYKVPERVLIVSELPRTAMAKIDKVATVALFEQGGTTGGTP